MCGKHTFKISFKVVKLPLVHFARFVGRVGFCAFPIELRIPNLPSSNSKSSLLRMHPCER